MNGRKELEDQLYYARRAREERQKIGACNDNAVAFVHMKLAEEYDRRARGGPSNLGASSGQTANTI